MNYLLVAVAAGLLSFGSVVRAEQACTQIGCQEGLTVSLKEVRWPAGRYRFTITADGRKTVCEGTLPFESCERQNVRCDGPDAAIGESGCALPKDAHGFFSVTLGKVPGDFTLDILHESGRTFHYHTPVTAYCGYPNGKRCDPGLCCSASLDVAVTWDQTSR